VITYKLASYPPAIRRALPNTKHRRQERLNNRAENSHLPTRKRERVTLAVQIRRARAALPRAVQRRQLHFRPRRHLLTASVNRQDPHRALHRLARRHPGRSAPKRPRESEQTLRHTRWLNLTTPYAHVGKRELGQILDGVSNSSHSARARSVLAALGRCPGPPALACGSQHQGSVSTWRAAYQALRATLHALRDRLILDEAVEFAAQLPMLIRASIMGSKWQAPETPPPRRISEANQSGAPR
jgi:hypothetical protein